MRLPLLENSQGRLDARQLEHLGYSLLQRTLRIRHSSHAGLSEPVCRGRFFWTDTLDAWGAVMMFTQVASLLGWQHSGRRIAIYDALIQGIRGELGYHVPLNRPCTG